ncbi:hypothetical protein COU56_01105 [Candidatus Pacearchaeota archaeon CG10_big_fil_rev_8_21_14_0_10_31_9]|nr:MAG: hypothetical protein AUJ62_03380 [Candidatus Pacearchaeota archaeon CG1_02_32_21]PIN95596.1 MAG: hypothetical protein COU56_01105 [Candidatus Pacearchaeota archaeon CG10_big_fil_rev_8_21_14_0_10_31_9]PIZ82931.1 MAG: hypothetical protein COX97_02325 [Candidatus Pacearchaeota archaeon CG_4_10_14_0_2_um_filter_05_32_18]
MIIFLVGSLKHNSKNRISLQGLELAVQDLIDEKNLAEAEKLRIKKILENNPEYLVSKECKYFKVIKPYLLPFLTR